MKRISGELSEIFVLTLTIILIFSGCGNTNNNSLALDIKSLVGKTEFEVAEILGKPDTAYAWSFLGRRYRINRYGKNSTEIRYQNGKTAEVILRNPYDIPFDAASLEKFGLPKTIPAFIDTSSTIQWKNLEGIKAINFYKVGRKSSTTGKTPTFEIYFNLN